MASGNFWTEQDLLDVIRQQNCTGMVTELKPFGSPWQIVGYIIYELCKGRLRLLNVAVDPAWRRRGIGTAMIDRMKEKLPQQRRNELLLDIRERNLPGQLFFQSQGFRATGVLRNLFHDEQTGTYEDGYELQFKLPANATDRISELT